jgi:hypothetical protein
MRIYVYEAKISKNITPAMFFEPPVGRPLVQDTAVDTEGPLDFRRTLGRLGNYSAEVNLKWFKDQIRLFSTRDLTYEKDSIRAFSGIMQHFGELEDPIYHSWGISFDPNHPSTS